MNSFVPVRYERDESGRLALIHCLVNGAPRTISRKRYFEFLEIILPEGPMPSQPTSTLPRDYQPAGNGRDS